MINTVYRPKRKIGGKTVTSRLYRGKYRVGDMAKPEYVSLGVTDKQVAQTKLNKFIQDKEKELAGIPVYGKAIELSEKLNGFISNLESLNKAKRYVVNTKNIINTLMRECNWKYTSDINAESFEGWRSKQTDKSGKTLNEYLGAIRNFLNWMNKREIMSSNPLKCLEKVDTRGKEVKKRRAFTDEEISRLLNIAGERMPLYATAVNTGLRRSELEQLQWGDVHLDNGACFIKARAATTKNKKDSQIPLSGDLEAILRSIRPVNYKNSDLVFPKIHRMREFIKDLKKAEIAYVDDRGHFADFHSFRHTFGTNLAKAGVNPREAMELMRHSDLKLTTKVYTDVTQLNTRKAVECLPKLANHDAPIRAPILDFRGRLVSQVVAAEKGKLDKKLAEFEAKSPEKSSPVTESHKSGDWLRQQDSNLRPSG